MATGLGLKTLVLFHFTFNILIANSAMKLGLKIVIRYTLLSVLGSDTVATRLASSKLPSHFIFLSTL